MKFVEDFGQCAPITDHTLRVPIDNASLMPLIKWVSRPPPAKPGTYGCRSSTIPGSKVSCMSATSCRRVPPLGS